MKNHFVTFVSHKVTLLGIFLQKLNYESYIFARLDFSTQNLDSTRHFRYVSVRYFNFPKMAKFGIKISQIRPYNGTKKLKICLASYFGLKNSGFEISTIFDHMVFVQYYFPKTSLVTQIGSDFKITKFLSQICLWNHFQTFWPSRNQVKVKAGVQYRSHGTAKK